MKNNKVMELWEIEARVIGSKGNGWKKIVKKVDVDFSKVSGVYVSRWDDKKCRTASFGKMISNKRKWMFEKGILKVENGKLVNG